MYAAAIKKKRAKLILKAKQLREEEERAQALKKFGTFG